MHNIHRSTGEDATTASANYCGPKENERVACFCRYVLTILRALFNLVARLFLSHSIGMGRREPWEQGWALFSKISYQLQHCYEA